MAALIIIGCLQLARSRNISIYIHIKVISKLNRRTIPCISALAA